jgi:hypothetical protein
LATASVSLGVSFLELRGHQWARFPSRTRQTLVSAAFDYWRREGFPYYDLTSVQVHREFECLVHSPSRSVFTRAGALGSLVGIRVANVFKPRMWSVRVSRYRSPMDVFQDDDLLRAAIERAWTVWPDRFGANASSLRRMLKTFPGTASVSNFRPTLAKAIVERFSPEGGTVVDFSAGFGGRLVGCLALKRHYVGIEPSARQVAGLRRTIRTLAKVAPGSAAILQGCAEDSIGRWTDRHVDLIFSSPPYFDWERYSGHPSQSYVRYRTYERWLSCFLGPLIEHSHEKLAQDGYLVLNVSEGRRLPTPDAVECLARRVGFKLHRRIPLLLARVPYLHPRSWGAFKPEVLLVFQKRQRRAS